MVMICAPTATKESCAGELNKQTAIDVNTNAHHIYLCCHHAHARSTFIPIPPLPPSQRLCQVDHYRSAVSGNCVSCVETDDGGNPHLGPIFVLLAVVVGIMLWALSYKESFNEIYEARRNQILVGCNHGTMM